MSLAGGHPGPVRSYQWRCCDAAASHRSGFLKPVLRRKNIFLDKTPTASQQVLWELHLRSFHPGFSRQRLHRACFTSGIYSDHWLEVLDIAEDKYVAVSQTVKYDTFWVAPKHNSIVEAQHQFKELVQVRQNDKKGMVWDAPSPRLLHWFVESYEFVVRILCKFARFWFCPRTRASQLQFTIFMSDVKHVSYKFLGWTLIEKCTLSYNKCWTLPLFHVERHNMGRIIGWIPPTQRSSSFCFCDVFLTKSRLDQFTWRLRVIFAWRTCCCKKARIAVMSQTLVETTNRCWRWPWHGQGLKAYPRPCVERGNLCFIIITVERETSLQELEKTFELLLCHFEIR